MPHFRNPALGVIALAALAACSDTPSSPANQPLIPQIRASSQVDQVVPGEVLVKFRDGSTGVLTARKYASGIRRSGYRHAYEVLSAEPGQERALAAQLSQDPNVEWAEPNYIRHVDVIDSRLWAFFNPGGKNMSFFNDPNGSTGPIPASYASTLDSDEDAINGIAAGGADVVIGSIDTGVDFSHPEFTGRLIAGCDWYAQADAGNASATCTDFTPNDITTEGHGTHTTGTMAGTTVGVAGVTGAGPHVKVYVQRVCGPVGCYTSSIINAIRAAADQPNLVAMNLSLGGTTESAGEKSAITYATGKGVLVIASSGNGGNNKVGCPACDVNAISVGATDWKDVRTSYSQYGTGLDIVAPGGLCYSNTTPEGCIFSSVVAGYSGAVTGPLAGGTYTWMNGTSMAAPQVTGAAAAVASKTGLRGSALRTRLQSTADDKGAAGVDTQYGNGRLNVYRAVTNTVLGAGQ
jgi:subtilisin family serine protease